METLANGNDAGRLRAGAGELGSHGPGEHADAAAASGTVRVSVGGRDGMVTLPGDESSGCGGVGARDSGGAVSGLVTWNVALEARNSAWVTWRKWTVQAETADQAQRAALAWAHTQTGRWTHEHEDYCPQDWSFKVIGVVPASQESAA